MSIGTLPRKERKKLQKKEEILEIARAIFNEKGFLLTSIEDIANRSDVAVGSIYNFFKNKDDLYVQVIKELFKEFFELFNRRLALQKDLKGTVAEIIDLKLDFFFKYRAFSLGVMEAVSSGIFSREKNFKWICLEFNQEYIQKLTNALQPFPQLKTKGIDVSYLAMTLDGTISSFLYSLAHGRIKIICKEEALKNLTAYFFKLLGLDEDALETENKI